MPHFEENPQESTLPAHVAAAVEIWCDDPDFGKWLPPTDIKVDIGDQIIVPFGAVVKNLLENEDGVPATLIPQSLQDKFDYHGMRLSEFADAPGRLFMELNSMPRPTGWEHPFIRQLDARFSRDPNLELGPEMFRAGDRPDLPFEHTMTRLEGTGLTESNWRSMPHLAAAFERHQIPIECSGKEVRIDKRAYEEGLRQRHAAASLAAAARMAPGQSTGSRDGSNTAPALQIGERRRREHSPSSPTGSPPPQRRRG